MGEKQVVMGEHWGEINGAFPNTASPLGIVSPFRISHFTLTYHVNQSLDPTTDLNLVCSSWHIVNKSAFCLKPFRNKKV